VWSNVVAGWTAAHGGLDGQAAAWLIAIAAAISLMYTGGMFLNDAFDAGFDRAHRPDRPVPSGNVTPGEAFAVGGFLLLIGTASLEAAGIRSLLWGLGLAAAILFYDYRHKGFGFGPVLMGLCRGLVYCVAGSAVAALSPSVYVPALLLTLYTASLTVVARQAGSRAAIVVPLMIAAISLVDGAVIAWSGGAAVALIGPLCFALTLALQRVVPGT